MTDDQIAEFGVLKMANEHGAFALQLGVPLMPPPLQFALERMQRRGWVTLIDLSPISEHPDRLFRVFLASSAALTWFRRAG